MTKREIDLAFGDLDKYADDLNQSENKNLPIEAKPTGKISSINFKD